MSFGSIPHHKLQNGLTGQQIGGYFASLRNDHKTRWKIVFNMKGPRGKGSWPILFKSQDAAYDAITLLPVFANKKETATRGRIVSCAVVKVQLR